MTTVCLNPAGDDGSEQHPQSKNGRNVPAHSFGVANWFLVAGKGEQIQITLPKLQRFVYLAYGRYFAYEGSALFAERIAMSAYGPVIVPLDKIFSGYVTRPINRFAQILQDDEVEAIDFSVHPDFNKHFGDLPYKERQSILEASQKVISHLRAVWLSFRQFSTSNLLASVCGQGSQIWQIYDKLIAGGTDGYVDYVDLSPKMIQDYFKDFFNIAK
jgi:uncharacterized phage-associated protein